MIVGALAHADRSQPCRWYLKGLMLPGERKSVEPMAARVQPDNVRSAHQSMHHLVADAPWSDRAVLSAVSEQVLPKLLASEGPVWWIIDDTGFPKRGKHSVGVARQYCGQTGKRDNCQIAVSLSIANARGSLPIDYQLYLPREWAEDADRRDKCGVPDDVVFETKPALAMQQIEAALSAGYRRGVVLADAAYGGDTDWREQLAGHGLSYAVGVRSTTSVWWGPHQPVPEPKATSRRGRPRCRVQRDATHQPISVGDLARELPKRAWREVSWRDGVAGPLSSRFARVRVRAAKEDRKRDEEWLIIEWPEGAEEPAHYWFSNLAKSITWKAMIDTVMGRWRIERDYQELKQELGLGRYEGRNWRGFHHHATLC
ncbi:MAG: IS701 family transposase, partial [Wenzhouxiangella sp.]|nr:IS701 family transposase [Wenzhouxiangella sp.]